ncbi:MAG: SPFH domain-containing protein [Oscillospiraceae bacterium]|jgi:membrane protease subunit (stomatin/prohibitin family)
MGLIKALAGAIGGSLADQWLEVIEADDMGGSTVFTSGIAVRRDTKRSSNTKSNDYTISNGSIIHVYDNQAMILVDGGKVVDYTTEPGYFKVDNSSLPSLFNGQFGDTLKETFGRFKYGGVPSSSQKAFFINLQEIKGIRFGTRTPVNYFDAFYNAELFLRTHGNYSIKITNPILFYMEAIPRNAYKVEINEINEQYLSEFLSALQAAVNQMSADGIRISHVASKSVELSKYMSNILDEEWRELRGFEVRAVGVASISYDDESTKLINMRNQGAMLSDPTVREGYVQGAVARGMEAAGSNAGGSMAGFMGMGIGMNAGGGFMGAASQSNQQQMQNQQKASPPEQSKASGTPVWKCECGAENTGKFCSECGKPEPKKPEGWRCECGAENTGRFCSECGKPCPPKKIKCDKCGFEPDISNGIPKFCPNCGDPINDNDKG